MTADQSNSVQGTSSAEKLLEAWLEATTAIHNRRFVSELTYNESVICRLLVEDWREGGEGLTAAALCRATLMQKSQMNRTLASLETRHLIERRPSPSDRRSQLVTIDPSHMHQFQKQHGDIIAFVEKVEQGLGAKRTHEVTKALAELAQCVRQLSGA